MYRAKENAREIILFILFAKVTLSRPDYFCLFNASSNDLRTKAVWKAVCLSSRNSLQTYKVPSYIPLYSDPLE